MGNRPICPICRESGYREAHVKNVDGKKTDVYFVDCNDCSCFYISGPACYELEKNPLPEEKIRAFREDIKKDLYQDLDNCIDVNDVVGD